MAWHWPPASVIVPVLDSLPALTDCVAALLAQDYPGRFEVIVADNGSAVSPAGHLPADPRLRVIVEPAPGSYAARNAALAVAVGDVLAFTDADCRAGPGWLRAAVLALQQQPAADLVGGAVVLEFSGGAPVGGAEWYEHLHGFRQEAYLGRGFAVTANMITRREVLERVGPFDATLASGGDAEWGRRVAAAGGVLRFAPRARVAHPARATRAELTRKARRTTRGVATTTVRRPGGRRALARMLAGHTRDLAARSVTVWFARQPPTLRQKVGYLRTSWAVSGATIGELGRHLLRR